MISPLYSYFIIMTCLKCDIIVQQISSVLFLPIIRHHKITSGIFIKILSIESLVPATTQRPDYLQKYHSIFNLDLILKILIRELHLILLYANLSPFYVSHRLKQYRLIKPLALCKSYSSKVSIIRPHYELLEDLIAWRGL